MKDIIAERIFNFRCRRKPKCWQETCEDECGIENQIHVRTTLARQGMKPGHSGEKPQLYKPVPPCNNQLTKQKLFQNNYGLTPALFNIMIVTPLQQQAFYCQAHVFQMETKSCMKQSFASPHDLNHIELETISKIQISIQIK